MKKKHRRAMDIPAGHGRREELRRSKDVLEEEIEEIATTEDKIAVKPSAFKKDREIIGLITASFDITNKDPNYEYCWARCVPGDERQVQQKLALQVNTTHGQMPTWEVVKGDMLEAIERKEVTGYRRIADTILMRCRKDIYLYLQRHQEEVNRRFQGSITSEMEAFAHENRGNIIAHTDPDDPAVQRIVNQGYNDQMAMKRVDRHMREGTMPGAEMRR